MRDFPVFTTENGVASLVLREVPYRQCAYIKLISTQTPEALLKECYDFCVLVGAESVFAAGHRCLEGYPLHSIINKMEIDKAMLPAANAVAVPVTQEELPRWKDIYNEKMKNIANASYMDDAGAKEMLKDSSGYFVYQQERCIGICKGRGDCIEVIASMCPGAGKDVLLALVNELDSPKISLQVAHSNAKAIHLYKRLGFVQTEEISRWYEISGMSNKNT